MNVRPIRAKQAHNPLGTPSVEKSVLRGAQIFKLSNIFELCSTRFFKGVEKNVRGGFALPLLTVLGQSCDPKPPTRLAQVRSSLPAEAGSLYLRRQVAKLASVNITQQ